MSCTLPPVGCTLYPMTTLRTAKRFVFPLLGLWVLLYASFSIFKPPLLDGSDALTAVIAREMVIGGHWISPCANGIRYSQRPPLLYWTVAVSFGVFDVSDWAARVPLALGALALFIATFSFGRRLFHSPAAAFYAALTLLTSYGVFLFGHLLLRDVFLCLWITLALNFFWRSLQQEKHILESTLGFAVCCALGVLTRGLAGAVLPAGDRLSLSALHRQPEILRPLADRPRRCGFSRRRFALAHRGSTGPMFATRWSACCRPSPADASPSSSSGCCFFSGSPPGPSFPFALSALAVPHPIPTVAARRVSSAFSGSSPSSSSSASPPARNSICSPRSRPWPCSPAAGSPKTSRSLTIRAASPHGSSSSSAWLQPPVVAYLLVVAPRPAPGTDIATLLRPNAAGHHAVFFGFLFDLTRSAMGAFRVPLWITLFALLVGVSACLWYRLRDNARMANCFLAGMIVAILIAAHLALNTFSPVLSSAILAEAIKPEVRSSDVRRRQWSLRKRLLLRLLSRTPRAPPHSTRRVERLRPSLRHSRPRADRGHRQSDQRPSADSVVPNRQRCPLRTLAKPATRLALDHPPDSARPPRRHLRHRPQRRQRSR